MDNSLVLTICSSGFLFLCGCLFAVTKQLPDVKRMATDLCEIKQALLGTMEKKGFISKLHDTIDDVEDLKERVVKLE